MANRRPDGDPGPMTTKVEGEDVDVEDSTDPETAAAEDGIDAMAGSADRIVTR